MSPQPVRHPDQAARTLRCRGSQGPAAGGPHRRQVTLTIRGDVDLVTVPDLRRRICSALGNRPDRLVLNLSRCAFADCRAVTLLLRARADAERQGTRLVLRDPSAPVRRLLELTSSAAALDVERAS